MLTKKTIFAAVTSFLLMLPMCGNAALVFTNSGTSTIGPFWYAGNDMLVFADKCNWQGGTCTPINGVARVKLYAEDDSCSNGEITMKVLYDTWHEVVLHEKPAGGIATFNLESSLDNVIGFYFGCYMQINGSPQTHAAVSDSNTRTNWRSLYNNGVVSDRNPLLEIYNDLYVADQVEIIATNQIDNGNPIVGQLNYVYGTFQSMAADSLEIGIDGQTVKTCSWSPATQAGLCDYSPYVFNDTNEHFLVATLSGENGITVDSLTVVATAAPEINTDQFFMIGGSSGEQSCDTQQDITDECGADWTLANFFCSFLPSTVNSLKEFFGVGCLAYNDITDIRDAAISKAPFRQANQLASTLINAINTEPKPQDSVIKINAPKPWDDQQITLFDPNAVYETLGGDDGYGTYVYPLICVGVFIGFSFYCWHRAKDLIDSL
jgi:hypothetical protein